MSNFEESKHPRADDGKFTDGNGRYSDGVNDRIKWAKENGIELPLNADGSVDDLKLQEIYDSKKKMTPAEKIASVHIDFTRDNILPELNEEDLTKIGAKENKPVLLKKNVIDRNAIEHADLTENDFESILKNALYAPSEIFSANAEKPYFHFAKVIEINSKGKPEIGLALLDVDDKKENFEIVHAHFMEIPRFNKMQKKRNKKD